MFLSELQRSEHNQHAVGMSQLVALMFYEGKNIFLLAIAPPPHFQTLLQQLQETENKESLSTQERGSGWLITVGVALLCSWPSRS